MVVAPEKPKGWRRSIYVQQRRVNVLTTLDLFDYPQMTPNCVERTNTAGAPQALHLSNNKMFRDLADYFAQRVRKEVGDNPEREVERVHWYALSRPPTAEEKRIILKALEDATKTGSGRAAATEQVLARFCHTIINSAAFIFID